MYKDTLDSDGLSFSERCIERDYYYDLDNFIEYDESDNNNSNMSFSLIELYINDKLDR